MTFFFDFFWTFQFVFFTLTFGIDSFLTFFDFKKNKKKMKTGSFQCKFFCKSTYNKPSVQAAQQGPTAVLRTFMKCIGFFNGLACSTAAFFF